MPIKWVVAQLPAATGIWQNSSNSFALVVGIGSGTSLHIKDASGNLIAQTTTLTGDTKLVVPPGGQATIAGGVLTWISIITADSLEELRGII